jgi:hypothetical protein
MDLNGMTLRDHYQAIADERAREVAHDEWRRKHAALTAPDAAPHCCAEDAARLAPSPRAFCGGGVPAQP